MSFWLIVEIYAEEVWQRAFIAAPTCFVSPSMWKAHAEAIQSILAGSDLNWRTSDGQSRQNVQVLINESVRDVKKRNEALLFRTSAQPTKGCLRSTVSDVKV